MWHHGNFNISSKRRISYYLWFSYSWKRLFAAGSITEVKQKLFKQRSLCRVPTLVWSNNRYCNGMGVTAMHDAIEFYYCHVTTNVLNLIGTANFLAAEVTVWTCVSCQAISPTAWEQDYKSGCHAFNAKITYTDLSCGDIHLVDILQLSQCLCVCVCECLCRCRGVWVGEGEWEVWGDKERSRMREAEEGKVGEGGDVIVLRYSLMVLSDYSLQWISNCQQYLHKQQDTHTHSPVGFYHRTHCTCPGPISRNL